VQDERRSPLRPLRLRKDDGDGDQRLARNSTTSNAAGSVSIRFGPTDSRNPALLGNAISWPHSRYGASRRPVPRDMANYSLVRTYSSYVLTVLYCTFCHDSIDRWDVWLRARATRMSAAGATDENFNFNSPASSSSMLHPQYTPFYTYAHSASPMLPACYLIHLTRERDAKPPLLKEDERLTQPHPKGSSAGARDQFVGRSAGD
jgi:hypothetical protein